MSASQILWLFASVFTAAGSVIGVVASLKIRRVRVLLREGSTARGVVIRLEETRIAPASDAGSTSRSVGTTVYYPVITWSTGDGRAMETRTNVARPMDRTLPVGARVEVRYDAADPSRWTLPAEGTAFWWLFGALGALFVAMGLGFALGGFRRII
ncbi:DUF3592 domain-containing protein [Streptomyces sp. NPDC001568]|uniref:DUF3592 domain-containing protein n=1 Tax=Streptomyces sp. NPDC001568 TaxID=3364588 RepID=UPI00368EF8C1